MRLQWRIARRAIRHPAAVFYPYVLLAPALALLDRREEAKIALDKLLEIKPDFSPDAVWAATYPVHTEALRPHFKTWSDEPAQGRPGHPRRACSG